MHLFSPRLRKAINTASIAHRYHVRKGSELPYVSHVFSVMYLLATVTDDEDILIAGLLHDTVEDVPERYNPDQLLNDFGQRTFDLVMDLTKDAALTSWDDRAQAYLYHLEFHAAPEAVLISLADKTHNLHSIFDDYAILGESLWQRFNAGKTSQKWWYQEVGAIAAKRLPKNSLLEQYQLLLDRLGEL